MFVSSMSSARTQDAALPLPSVLVAKMKSVNACPSSICRASGTFAPPVAAFPHIRQILYHTRRGGPFAAEPRARERDAPVFGDGIYKIVKIVKTLSILSAKQLQRTQRSRR